MATITTINATDLLSASRAVINTNFSNLNSAKVDGATALTTAGRLVEVASSGVATQTSFASSVVVLTSGSYADPAWVTSLATTKLTGTLQAAQFPALTGDITTSTGAVATTLANTAVTPASYGSATQVATFTVDSKGRLTAAASTSIAIAASQVTSGTLDNARTTAASTNTVSAIVARDASGNFAAGTITATFSGNLTGNVTGNASGTAATITGALALSNTPLTTRGDLLVATTATPILGRLAKGTQYQVLLGGATDPTWGALDLSQASAITGILPVGNGGTGATTLSGAGIVAGAASITTANALLIGASAGVLGQSDATFVSGVLTRAGTLGLAATGANVVTVSTNGVVRGTISSTGLWQFPNTVQLIIATNAGNYSPGAFRIYADTSDNAFLDATSGHLSFQVGAGTKARIASATGNFLIGTTTDDGASKLQVAGIVKTTGTDLIPINIVKTTAPADGVGSYLAFYNNADFLGGIRVAYRGGTADANKDFDIFSGGESGTPRVNVKGSGNVLVGGTTDGNYRLDVQSSGSTGTMRVYDQTAVTGSSTLVVRAGAGQSTTALLSVNANNNTPLMLFQETTSADVRLTFSDRAGAFNLWAEVLSGTTHGRINTAGGGAGAAQLSLGTGNTDVLTIKGGNSIGFFGVTPVARAAALTAADASALTSSDATVIGNMRTRIGEIATALQNLGLIN